MIDVIIIPNHLLSSFLNSGASVLIRLVDLRLMNFRSKTDERSLITAQVLLALETGINMTILVTPMSFDLACHEGDTTPCIRGWNPLVPVSIFALGGVGGTLVTKSICRKAGLWNGILFSSILFSIGSFCVALGYHVVLVSVGRFLTGMAAGGSLVAIPFRRPLKYSALELSLMPLVYASATVGMILGLLLDRENILSYLWIPFIVSICILVALGVITLLRGLLPVETIDFTKIPSNESTRDEDKSLEINGEIPVEQFEVQDEDGDKEIDIEVQFVQVGLKELFIDLKYRTTLISVIALFTSQQFTGIAFYTQYLGELFIRNVHGDDRIGLGICPFFGFILLGVSPMFIVILPKEVYLFSLCLSIVASVLIVSGDAKGSLVVTSIGMFLMHSASCLCIFSFPFIKVVDFAPKEASDAAHTLGMLTGWTSMFIVLLVSPLLRSVTPSMLHTFGMLTLVSIVVIAVLSIPVGDTSRPTPTPKKLQTSNNDQVTAEN